MSISLNAFVGPNNGNLKLHYANLLTVIVEWWNRTTNAKKHSIIQPC